MDWPLSMMKSPLGPVTSITVAGPASSSGAWRVCVPSVRTPPLTTILLADTLTEASGFCPPTLPMKLTWPAPALTVSGCAAWLVSIIAAEMTDTFAARSPHCRRPPCSCKALWPGAELLGSPAWKLL